MMKNFNINMVSKVKQNAGNQESDKKPENDEPEEKLNLIYDDEENDDEMAKIDAELNNQFY